MEGQIKIGDAVYRSLGKGTLSKDEAEYRYLEVSNTATAGGAVTVLNHSFITSASFPFDVEVTGLFYQNRYTPASGVEPPAIGELIFNINQNVSYNPPIIAYGSGSSGSFGQIRLFKSAQEGIAVLRLKGVFIPQGVTFLLSGNSQANFALGESATARAYIEFLQL